MTGRAAPVADWVTIPDLHRDPFPIYERLRAEGGVHWVPAVGRYLVSSYEAVHETELDQELFSANEEGSLQIRAMGHSMLRRDDPEHYLERKAWQPALRPGEVKRTWTQVFERNAAKYLDEFAANGPAADLIWDFAAPYAAENLRELLGLHNAHQTDLQRWSQTMIDATGNYADDARIWELGKTSFDEVDLALDEMLAWHAKHLDNNPTLIAQLLRAPGELMPIERIRANVKMTIGGGLNEPRDAIGVAAWALLTHPDQRDAVVADSTLWPAVFDEALRWVAPIGLYSRQVTRDTELAGVHLPAGAKLGICLLSANRDATVWSRAEEFDIHREVQPHLAFGKGVHVCLGAWVAKAEVAAVGLPQLFNRFAGLSLVDDDPAEIAGWVFRGMTKLPVAWQDAPATGRSPAAELAPPASAPEARKRIAIVGAGPSGCFIAQALRKSMPEAEIDMIEAQPVPYGLVRYGVAPDHQGTKSVARQFDRLLLDPQVRFHGNVRLGTDVSLASLRASADAVVLATGVHRDIPLRIPGADLVGVHGAGELTRVFNGHPDQPAVPPLGETVAIVGHGNVALDVARLLTRTNFTGSDVDDRVHGQIAGAVRTVHLVGRGAPESAKFDPVMVRELAGLPGVQHVVHGVDIDAAVAGKDARLDAVLTLADSRVADPGARIEWWFGATPEAILGDASVSGVRISTESETRTLEVQNVITAIGFSAQPEAAESIPVAPGEFPSGRVEPGLYVGGWLRRGSRGTIRDQREDARQLARLIAEDLSELPSADSSIAAFVPPAHAVDFTGWRRIDHAERRAAGPGRVRAKIRTRAGQLQAARDVSLDLPVAEERSDSAATPVEPVTILFATESGGAELAAEELHARVGELADVRVRDIADLSPAELDPARLHLILCSTYGDGELPTSARAFHAQLSLKQHDLSGLRYAMFGLGDRSYTKTYSRGSELLDEALAECGARRVGEFGRHDAGGALETTEAAIEWVDGVFAEVQAGESVLAGIVR
ncbi:cytochrome P450 [Leucobacter sp. W1038]|uniref:cytochrome P450 n=1 Tax=Leucobacter sp. W1038 TaxID=3438281 RepID=UPI003D972C97